MKKNRFAVVLLWVLVIAMSLSACGNTAVQQPATQPATQPVTPAAPDDAATDEPIDLSGINLTFYTGGTTGTYYAFGAAVALMWNEVYPGLDVQVQSSGGAKANLYALVDDECDIGFVQNDMAYYAINGIDIFEGQPETGYYGIAALYPEVVQITGIKGLRDVSDVKGMRVSMGELGQGVLSNTNQIFEAYGITLDDVEAYNLSVSDAADQIKDGKLDAYFTTSGCPAPHIVDLMTVKDCDLIGIRDDIRDQLIKDYAFYSKYTIKAGVFEKIDYDVETLAVKSMLLVNDNMPDDVAYALTKALFEHSDEVSHSKAADINIEEALVGMTVPLHPGAARYYAERGYSIS